MPLHNATGADKGSQRSLRCFVFGAWILFALLPLLTGPILAAEPPAVSKTNQHTVDYMLVVTGEELLRGAFADTHTAFITRTLHLMGCHCVGSVTVDDRAEDIRDALQYASKKAKLVIVTGGLGPTVNDVTRGAISDFTGIPLAEHPEALSELERRFQQPSDQLRPNLRRQALVPARGGYFKNPIGTAVGLVFESENATILALPGPPRELRPMVENEVVPYLRRKFGVRPPGSSLTVRFVGIGQSQIDQTISQHLPLPPDVVVGSTFDGSRVDFIFALPGNTPEDRARLRAIEDKLRQHLGEYFYSDDDTTLEAVVVKLLQSRAGSLTIAEIGTGGSLAASLHTVAGTKDLLTSAFVTPTEERMRSILELPPQNRSKLATASERAKALAAAAQKKARSKYVIAVGPIQFDSTGKQTVWVAFGSSPSTLQTKQLPLQGTGETSLANLVTQILDELRRTLNR